jgi:hypothetical protein
LPHAEPDVRRSSPSAEAAHLHPYPEDLERRATGYPDGMRSPRRRKVALAFVAFDVVATIVARLRGYPFGGNVVVRCRKGHLFTTIWIPGVSVKSLRLGWWRFQHCPIGGHWSIVAPVKESRLTWVQRRSARSHKDVRVP